MFALAQETKIIRLGLDFKNVELEGKYLSPGAKKENDVKPLTLTIGWCLSFAKQVVLNSLFLPWNFADSFFPHAEQQLTSCSPECSRLQSVPLDSESGPSQVQLPKETPSKFTSEYMYLERK